MFILSQAAHPSSERAGFRISGQPAWKSSLTGDWLQLSMRLQLGASIGDAPADTRGYANGSKSV